MSLLPLLLFSSIVATIVSRPINLPGRGALEICIPIFRDCTHQWTSPPVVFTNPSFTTPIDDINPSYSPLVASPPPPGYTIPGYDNYDDTNVAPPSFSFLSPPAYGGNSVPSETILPPIAERGNQPGFVMSPPQLDFPPPDIFSVPPPPLVDTDTQPPQDDGEIPMQQPPQVILPPPVDEKVRVDEQKPKPPVVVQSPPPA